MDASIIIILIVVAAIIIIGGFIAMSSRGRKSDKGEAELQFVLEQPR